MRLLSLFSGIGAFEKALERCGIPYELVNYCEIDKYASKAYSLIHKVDETKNLGDITTVDPSQLGEVDMITYGFPCQDISIAGKQKGFADENGERTRSGLFFEALRIIEATKPRIAIAENVKALTMKKFKAEFETVLQSLEDAGYNNYWKVLNAKDYGIPQNRERVFIISIRKDIDRGFEFPQPFPLERRLKDMLEDSVDEKYYLSAEKIANLVMTMNGQKSKNGGGIQVVGFIKRDDGKQHQSNMVYDAEGLSPAQYASQYKDPIKIIQVAQMYPNSGNPQAGRIYDPQGMSPSLDTCQGGNRMPKVLVGDSE